MIRILERDDAADQVDARGVGLRARPRAGRKYGFAAPSLARARGAPRTKRDVAALVLDVDLDRVQAARCEREVLLELAGERHQRARDVDAADLLAGAAVRNAASSGASTPAGLRATMRRAARPTGERAGQRRRRRRREAGEDRERGQAPAADLAAARVPSPAGCDRRRRYPRRLPRDADRSPSESRRGPLRRDDRRACSPRAASRSTRTTTSLLQPSSVDVRVDRYFRVFHNNRYPYIDVKEAQEDLTELVEVDGESRSSCTPASSCSARRSSASGCPTISSPGSKGKSSLGRLGLLIHSTAGFIDPGWDGHVTLELSNVANLPITIYHGMKIGQLSFVQMTEPAETPYGAGDDRLEVPGPAGPDAVPLLEELRATSRLILVTGATGFVGAHVVHALRADELARARASSATGEGGERLEAWGCELVEGDVTEPETLRAAVDGLSTPSSTSSRSGRAAREQFQRVMVDGTREPRRRPREEPAFGRFVLMSALGVERGDEGPRPVLPREVGRWSSDVKESGIPHVIFRPSFVFGEGRRHPADVREARAPRRP